MMQRLETFTNRGVNVSTVEPKSEMDMPANEFETLIERYQRLTINTAVYPEAGQYTEKELNYLIIGLLGEAGELANKFKKFIRKGQVTLAPDTRLVLTSEERRILTDEMGDILWYFARIGRVLGMRIEEIALDNYMKLGQRAKQGELKDHS